MDALAIINKYYPEDNELKHILLAHSRSVADKALWIAGKHPELNLDKQFLEEAAMLGKERGEGVKEYFTLWGRWDNPF